MAVHGEGKTRALRVCVAPGSKAESASRRHVAGASAPEATRGTVIADGFQPRPDLDLHDQGGKIIADLVFKNFFVGGPAAWSQSDLDAINTNLDAAMSDAHLNNVIVQYYRGATAISSTFRGATVLPGPAPASMAQADIESLVKAQHDSGALNGFDLGATVFNVLLPRGTVLTTGDGTVSSLEGLGGFHGSVTINTDKVYYAVGVYSEGNNGIVAFDQPWKNVVATFYHELNEARTDPDVEDGAVAWVTNERPSEEIGDTPMSLAGNNVALVMKEVPRADGSGTVPIQLMWSNAVHGPEGPIDAPH